MEERIVTLGLGDKTLALAVPVLKVSHVPAPHLLEAAVLSLSNTNAPCALEVQMEGLELVANGW